MGKKLIRCFLSSLCLLPSLVYSQTSIDYTAERQTFNRAEHALKKNDFQNYERLADQLHTYPLYPYLRYERLKKHIESTVINTEVFKEIADFDTAYPDFPFSSTLYSLALEKVSEKKQPALYVEGYQSYQAYRNKNKKSDKSENESLKCRYLLAQYGTTHDASIFKQAESMWLVGYTHSPACDQLFSSWQNAGKFSAALYWDRFRLALENRNFTLTEQLSKKLNKEKKALASTLVEITKTPQLIMKKSFLDNLTLSPIDQAEVITQGLRIYAKNDAQTAYQWWDRYQSDYPFTQEQIRMIRRDIAVLLSQQKAPIARSVIESCPETILDTTAKEWRVRLALAEHDWPKVLHWINQLPAEKITSDWRYWQARAHEALNQPDASTLYRELSKTRNYYGFLASLHNQQAISLLHEPLKADPKILEEVSQLPAIQRFYELQAIGKKAQARVEWFRATDKMQEAQLVAMAHIAKEHDLYDVAILTLAKTQSKNDMSIRFPLAYQDEITTLAHYHNLDPAWIYAIIRQESAFFSEAVSPAGARGLMQLMPSTAEILAKKFDIPLESDNALHRMPINIQLGSAYLKNLKDRMQNHMILATASYNAGPKQVYRWVPEEPLEADIWIETMPYGETREYVKNVIAFTSIYRQRLGYPVALNLIMKPTPAKPFL